MNADLWIYFIIPYKTIKLHRIKHYFNKYEIF